MGYVHAVVSLRVLAVGLPLVIVNYGLTHFLLARDKGNVAFWLAAMMLALTVALDLCLIPRHQGPGAALATVLAEVVLTAACIGVLRRRRTGQMERGTRDAAEIPEQSIQQADR